MVKAPRSEREAAAEKRQGTEGTGEGRRSPEDRGVFWRKAREWQSDCGKSVWGISASVCVSFTTALQRWPQVMCMPSVDRFVWSAVWSCGVLLGDDCRCTHADSGDAGPVLSACFWTLITVVRPTCSCWGEFALSSVCLEMKLCVILPSSSCGIVHWRIYLLPCPTVHLSVHPFLFLSHTFSALLPRIVAW